MALAQVFDWAMNKDHFYFACLSYIKVFTLNWMFEIISSLRLCELQELIEYIYYISPFYGKLRPRENKGYVTWHISLFFSTCLFLSYTCIIKMWFWERFILTGNICSSLPISWAKDGNIGMRLRFPNCQYHWTGHINRKTGLNVNILEKEMTLKIMVILNRRCKISACSWLALMNRLKSFIHNLWF